MKLENLGWLLVGLEDGCLALLRNRKDGEEKGQNCITWLQDKGFSLIKKIRDSEKQVLLFGGGGVRVCVFGVGSNRERKFNLSEDSIRLQ